MNKNIICDESKKPSFNEIDKFINNKLWEDINKFIKESYNVLPSLSYSKCNAQPGWNIKYKKGSKSICTLYPMEGYFIILIVIGNKELEQTEFILSSFSKYVQKLYNKTPFLLGGKWLMINITDKKILEDVKNLIKIRVMPK